MGFVFGFKDGPILKVSLGYDYGHNVRISSFTKYPRLSGQPSTPEQMLVERVSQFIPFQHGGGIAVPLHTS